MKIKRLEIKNYRNLADIVIDFKNLTILIGKNDAGKSNIIKALDLFFNGESSEDIKEIASEVDTDEIGFTSEITLKDYRIFNKNRANIQVTGYIELDENEFNKLFPLDKIELEVVKGKVINYPRNNTIIISEKIATKANKRAKFEITRVDMHPLMLYRSTKKDQAIIMGKDGKLRHGGKGKNVSQLLIKSLRKKFRVIPAFRRLGVEDRSTDPAKPDGTFMANEFLRYEKETSADKEQVFDQINQDMAKIFPSYDRVTAKTEDNQERVNVYFKKFPSSSVGSGINQLFVNIFNLDSHENTIFGMEEPEIHLHPKAQRDVFDFLKHQSENKQIIMTTHSSIFTDLSKKTNLYLIKKDIDNTARVVQIKNNLEESEIL